jgi:predicted Zn-dependent protease
LGATLAATSSALAIEVNQDGNELIQRARQAYATDIGAQPIADDPALQNYLERVVKRLTPAGKNLPAGVRPRITVLTSPDPQLYSYADGHMVISTGAVFSMDNEAQLAAILAHELTHALEGHYVALYQEIRAAARREESKAKRKALAGGILKGILSAGIDYVAQVEGAERVERALTGEMTYKNTMKSLAKIELSRDVAHSITDVIDNIPAKNEQGQWIDPRERLEIVADAQSMEYLARAGYDVKEAAKGWTNFQRVRSQLAGQQGQMFRDLERQMRQSIAIMQQSQTSFGDPAGGSGLIRTPSEAPVARAELVANFINLKEVQAAQQKRAATAGREPYLAFLRQNLLPRADRALSNDEYPQALADYTVLYDKGIQTSQVLYGLAKSSLGDFAFSASTAEKRRAETLYREAARKNPKFATPYRGLGELYEDWERYDEAIGAYKRYLRLAPKARDRNRIARKISSLERKMRR